MQALFSPFAIKGLQLKNRIVMPGLASFLFADDGSVSEATIEHYRQWGNRFGIGPVSGRIGLPCQRCRNAG